MSNSKIERKKVLFISNTSPDKTYYILDAFKERGDIDLKILHLYEEKIKKKYIFRVFHKLKIPIDISKINIRILKLVQEYKPDIIFIVKGNSIYPDTLKRIRTINFKNN